MAKSQDCLFSPFFCILSYGSFLFAILIAVLSLSSFAAADNIYQTKSMSVGKYWGDAEFWSGAVPSTSTTNDYFVGQGASVDIAFRTKDQTATAGSSDAFPNGNTLWMGYNTDKSFSVPKGQIALKSWNFTINNLQLGNALINQAMADGTANLKGSMAVNGTVVFQFSGAAGRKINVQSAISGAGEITLWEDSNNDNLTISSANNAFTGTLNVNKNSCIVLSGANAMQNASSIVLNSGSTLKLNAAQNFVENSISGSGKLQIRADQNSVADQTALYGVSNNFTGTINVTNNARAYYSKPLSSSNHLVIDNGAQFVMFNLPNVVINSDIELSGQGKGIASYKAGGLVFQGVNSAIVNGKININSDNSMIGAYAWADAVLAGDIDTNGYLLEFRQTRDSSDTATFTILGDVLSSGGSLGKIQFAHDIGAKVTTYLRIGDASAANDATMQVINANITNKNKKEIIFQPGANRTVTVAGTLGNDSSGGNTKGFIKEGEGTLVLNGGLSTLMTVNAGIFEITDAAVENVAGKITVNANGTLEFNVSDGQTKALTIDANNKISGTGKITKTGDGTLQINAAQGSVDAQSLVVSSGRLDMKEYFKGDLEINNSAMFSPGNSVGKLEQTGNFTLDSGAMLLMEIGGTDAELNDQLIVSGTTTYQDNSIILFALDPESTYTPAPGDTVLITMPEVDWSKATFSSYHFTLQGYENGKVILGVNSNAVPEPSTWALLVLGVAALFLRKRVRS